MKPNPGDGLLLHRHIPPLTRRYMAYFCSGAHTGYGDACDVSRFHVVKAPNHVSKVLNVLHVRPYPFSSQRTVKERSPLLKGRQSRLRLIPSGIRNHSATVKIVNASVY